MSVRKLQELVRHTPVYIQEDQVLNHLIGGAQTFGENFQHLYSNFRIFHNGFVEVTALESIAFDSFQCNCVCGTGQAVEDSEFSKTFSLAKDDERDLLSFRAD